MSTTITTTTTVESAPVSIQLMPDRFKILRQKLRALQVDGVRGGSDQQKFIPEDSLKLVLTRQEIKEIIHQLNHTVNPNITEKVFSKASRLLGILIMIDRESLLFNDFLDKDIYDSDLPIPEAGLQHLDMSIARDFHTKQYAFVVPTNILAEDPTGDTLSFDKNYILPFYNNKAICGGEGGFGKVYEMMIHKDYQGKTPQDIYFARKEFKQGLSKDRSFKAEKETLRALRKLKHENIVQLLAAYIHNGVYNLILPRAKHDLHRHLEIMESPKSSPERRVLFEQFSGVAKALDCIHNFSYEKKEMFGFHHDLKPQNILFHEDKFLIADFGLSHLKDPIEGSLTTWKAGTQSYGPPGVGPGAKIGRKYDIWSFGCILSEVLTFAVRGSKGVEEFREQRLKNQTPKPPNDCFHDGQNVKKEVVDWFDKLEKEFCGLSENIGRTLLELVRQMLAPNEQERPLSKKVVSTFHEALSHNSSRSSPQNMYSQYLGPSQQPPSGSRPNGYPQYLQTPGVQANYGSPQYLSPPSYPQAPPQTPPPTYSGPQPAYRPDPPHLAGHPYYPANQNQTASGYIQQPSGFAPPPNPPGGQHSLRPPQSHNMYPESDHGPQSPYLSGTYPQAPYSSPPPQSPYANPPPQTPQSQYGQPFSNTPSQAPQDQYGQVPYGYPPQNPHNPYAQSGYPPPTPQNSHNPYPQSAYGPHYPSNPSPYNAYAQPTHGSPSSALCQSCEEFGDRCPEHGAGRYYIPTPGCKGCEMLKDRCREHGTGIR